MPHDEPIAPIQMDLASGPDRSVAVASLQAFDVDHALEVFKTSFHSYTADEAYNAVLTKALQDVFEQKRTRDHFVTFPQSCDGKEQYAFEAWAKGECMEMGKHPMFYLFLDARTAAARARAAAPAAKPEPKIAILATRKRLGALVGI